jgi:single-stranded-DNA-specific exonuclease
MNDLSAMHALTNLLLEKRGISDPEEKLRFIAPDYERDGHDPFLILNMERAVDRILLAMKQEEKIIIYGDYDCDGIPGSVILHDLFKKIGYTKVENYIPHRHLEGYGLNKCAIEQFAKDGVTLVITIDCGITDVEEVALANTLGVDVIITDHHLPQAILPPAYAVINSKQVGDTYPDDQLCGAGVAFKLAQAILLRGQFAHIPEGWEKWLLDMAGLSTIADMVPLQKENRMLAYYGLKVLRKSPRLGLQALLREAGALQSELTEEDVGFTIGPRINAASRMDVPLRAFELLATSDEAFAKERAKFLGNLNTERKGEVARMVKEAKQHLKSREIRSVIVIGNPNWRVGVVGIVANQIAEAFDRPTFAWGKEGTKDIKGSCRSDGRINLVDLMCATSDGTFVDKGGHEFSGGFSVTTDNIHTLEDELVRVHAGLPKKEKPKLKYTVDTVLSVGEVNEVTYRAVNLLAPFGVGNPKPHFLFRGVTIVRAEPFGKEKNHLKLTLTDASGKQTQAIGFFMTAESFPLVDVAEGKNINLVATLEKSFFRGRPELRLRIVDILL